MITLHKLTPEDIEYTDNKNTHSGLLSAFNRNMDEHQMTILYADGLYRHLRFKNPDHGFYRFDLITWPGYLTITGDIGTYVFARVRDMFEFFTGYINTGYWAEKLQNGADGGRSTVKSYEEELFKQWVVQDFWETSRDMDPGPTKTWWEAIKDEVLDKWVDTSNITAALTALTSIDRFQAAPKYHYSDAWEDAEGWEQYDWHFELCLAAIVAGIRTYKTHQGDTQQQAHKENGGQET